jgi:hypothetical protein
MSTPLNKESLTQIYMQTKLAAHKQIKIKHPFGGNVCPNFNSRQYVFALRW